jgi:hypothetical protein
MKYRNVRNGRVVERPAADEWLEASAGWERVDEPAPEPKPKPAKPADNETPDAGADKPKEDD